MIENASIRAIEEELHRLNGAAAEPGQQTTTRTRILTHLVWIPQAWEPAASAVLAGLGERQPSRTIRLFPDPGSDRDALDAEIDLRCFARGPNRSVCSEVIAIWLRGRTAEAPASVVQPLLVSDLPATLRWRGALPFGAPELEQLVGVADRLIVDSSEWEGPGREYSRLPALFDRIAVSDIAWARTEPWRRGLAALWPGIAGATTLRVCGPAADARLLAGWLDARLQRHVELDWESARELERVSVDGREARPDPVEPATASDLLSTQLEIHGRDPIYEEAVRAA